MMNFGKLQNVFGFLIHIGQVWWTSIIGYTILLNMVFFWCFALVINNDNFNLLRQGTSSILLGSIHFNLYKMFSCIIFCHFLKIHVSSHCLTLSQQRVVVTVQYIDGTFLKKKTTNNLFFLIYNTTTIKTSEQQETPFKQVFWYVQL